MRSPSICRYYNGLVAAATYASSGEAFESCPPAKNKHAKKYVTRTGQNFGPSKDELYEIRKQYTASAWKFGHPGTPVNATSKASNWCRGLYYELAAQQGWHYA